MKNSIIFVENSINSVIQAAISGGVAVRWIMNLADPWSSSTSDSISSGDRGSTSLQFEDNFEPLEQYRNDNQQPRDGRLPDSDSYLAALERRLNRIRSNPTVLQQLTERREACMQHLLNDRSSTSARDNLELELEEPVNNYELLRFIRPEQALSVAELVHLVKYDHLEQEPVSHREEEQDSVKEGDESEAESSTSR